MRTVNVRWLRNLVVGGVLAGGLIHFLHFLQMKRIADVFLLEARQAQAEDRPDDAMRNLRLYVTLLPDDLEGQDLLGHQLLKAEAYGPAYLTLEKVLRLEPDREKTRRSLVTLGMKIGRIPEALANVEKLLKTSPKDAELLELQGRCHAALRDFDKAKASLESAIVEAPDRIDSYSLLAVLLETKLGNVAEASSCIDRMVANNPENYRAYLSRCEWNLNRLGKMNSGSPNESNAKVQLLQVIADDARRGIDLEPDSIDALALGIRYSLVTQSYDEARKYAQRGIELHPTESRFYLALADVETAASDVAAAQEVLRNGIRTVPRKQELQWNLALKLLDAGNLTESAAVIEQLKSSGYTAERVGYLEANLAIGQRRWQDAIRQFEAIRPKLADWPDLVKRLDMKLAMAYRETDAADQQLACYRRAIDLDPKWIPARFGLAESLAAANMVRQASEEYRRIVILPEAPVEAYVEFAKTLYSLILRREEALQDWSEFDDVLKQIERMKPTSKWVPMLRAQKLVSQGKPAEAVELIGAAIMKDPKEVDLWIVQCVLAQMDKNWEQLDRLFANANQQIGDNAMLRVMKGRSMVLHHGRSASEHLKSISEPARQWTEREKFAFLRNFTMMFLALGDYDEAERLGLTAAELLPGDLSIRLVLFDVALRAKRPNLMKRVLQEVRGITGDGAVWHYGEIINLMLSGNLKSDEKALANARIHLARAKALRPAWARLPLIAAEMELLQEDTTAATEYLKEAISLGDRNPAILERTISLLFSQKRFVEADQVVRLLQESQNLLNGDALRSASEISMRLNDPARALQLAESLVRSSKNNNDKVWLSQVLGVLGRSQEAEQQLRKVIAADGSAPEPWIVLVQVLVRSNQTQKAEKVVAEAEQAIAPDQAAIAIAQCYELMGKPDLARSRYQTALERAPQNMAYVRQVVEFQLRTGSYAEAESVLRNIFNRPNKLAESDRHWVARNLALTMVMVGKPTQMKEALALVESNLASKRHSQADERVKAMILARQTSSAARHQAIAILEKLLGRESETAIEDRFLLARLYVATGDRTKARAELRTILASNGNDVRFIAAYMQLILQSGDTREADNWLARLKSVAPNELVTEDFQAQLLFASGRYAELAQFAINAANRPPREQDGPDASLTRQLWGAKRLEEYAQKLLESKKLEVATQFIAKAETLYQQYLQRRPAEKLTLAEFYAHVDQIDRALELLKKHGNESAPERIAAVSGAIMKNRQSTPRHLVELQGILQTINKTLGWNSVLTLGTADLMSWRGEYEEAFRLYNEVLKRDRHDIVALNNKAVLLALTGGDSLEALRLVQQALEFGGPEDVLIDSRGLIHLATGNPSQALSDFESSLQENEDAERHFHVALAFAKLKQIEAARRSFQRAMDLGLSEPNLHPLERAMHEKLKQLMEKGREAA